MQALALVLLLLSPIQGSSQSSKAAERQPQKGVEKSAQKGSQKNAPVPKQYLPPSGMCRVWVDKVPAARQPAPTDCPTAIRNRPPNGRVLFPQGKDGRSAAPKSLQPSRPRPDTSKRKPPG